MKFVQGLTRGIDQNKWKERRREVEKMNGRDEIAEL